MESRWLKMFKGLLFILWFGTALGAAAADGAAPIKIRIAYPSGMNGQIPLTMERAGIAAKHGLSAEFHFFQYGPPMMEALASGHVDAVVTSLMPVTSYLSRRPGEVAVVAGLGASSYSLMVGQGSPIDKIEALKGKRIAVSFNSDSHLDLLRTLKERGLSPATDVKLLNVPPNELSLTLTEGYAEAIVIRQPQVLKMQEQFGARILHTWSFEFLSIMRSAYIAQHPDAVRRYREALREAIYYVAANKKQASEWFGERLRIDPEVVRRVSVDDLNYRTVKKLEDVKIDLTPDVRRKLVQWFDASYEHGMIKTRVAASDGNVFAN